MFNQNQMGKRIRSLRRKYAVSVDEVSKAIHTSQDNYLKIEDSTLPITAEIMYKLCRFYDVSADYLLGLDMQQKIQQLKYKTEESEAIINEIHDFIAADSEDYRVAGIRAEAGVEQFVSKYNVGQSENQEIKDYIYEKIDLCMKDFYILGMKFGIMLMNGVYSGTTAEMED